MEGPFKSKAAAVKHVLAKGFTKHEGTGESGDYGYGSREYYSKPGCETNQYGTPQDMLTISKVGGREWYVG